MSFSVYLMKVCCGGFMKANSLAFITSCRAMSSGESVTLKCGCSSARLRKSSIRSPLTGWLWKNLNRRASENTSS